jgi:alkanesulfonate monooxygenase SsuD/methylene tetrahydromethanopterin reductase-like flavin-dependent oxidoreductase (luciferase family)
MQIGMMLGAVYPSREEMSSASAFRHHLRFAELAAHTGYDGLNLNHHYLVGPEAQCFQPFPVAAVLLAKYPDMDIATTVFILPYHNPIDIAEQIATLDHISPGHLILGVGQGYRKNEADAFNLGRGERAGRMAECIAAMKLLWRDGPSSFQGRYFSFDRADIGVRPTRPEGPPIMIAADTVRTVERIPRIGGDHWVPSARQTHRFLEETVPAYKRALADNNKEFTGLPMTRDVCLADDVPTAERLITESYQRLLHMQSGWGQPGEKYDDPFEKLKENRIILGPPEKVAEELIDLHTRYGAEYVWIRCYTPGMDVEAALDMVQRIGEGVIPLVRRELGETTFFPRS